MQRLDCCTIRVAGECGSASLMSIATPCFRSTTHVFRSTTPMVHRWSRRAKEGVAGPPPRSDARRTFTAFGEAATTHLVPDAGSMRHWGGHNGFPTEGVRPLPCTCLLLRAAERKLDGHLLLVAAWDELWVGGSGGEGLGSATLHAGDNQISPNVRPV